MASQRDVTVDESRIGPITQLAQAAETVRLCNRHGKSVDADDLLKRFKEARGARDVRTLYIEPSSRLQDMRILATMPQLERLFVHGLRIRTLEGIDAFTSGGFIEVDTGRNRVRAIDALVQSNVGKLNLRCAGESDLKAIANAKSLRSLSLVGCGRVDVKYFRQVPLETLRLEGGTLTELKSLGSLDSLIFLLLVGCRRLRALDGRGSRAKDIVVEGCPALQVRTVPSFKRARSVYLVGVKGSFSLQLFSTMTELRSITLERCDVVDLDDLKLEVKLKNLEEMWISSLRKAEVIRLSIANPNVRVTNGRVAFLNGQQREQW